MKMTGALVWFAHLASGYEFLRVNRLLKQPEPKVENTKGNLTAAKQVNRHLLEQKRQNSPTTGKLLKRFFQTEESEVVAAQPPVNEGRKLPPELTGTCYSFCQENSEEGHSEGDVDWCVYDGDYAVDFVRDPGVWLWSSPLKGEATDELGAGRILSDVKVRRNQDGTRWLATFYGGNRFLLLDRNDLSKEAMRNDSDYAFADQTNCGCYLVAGIKQSEIVLANFHTMETVGHFTDASLEEACAAKKDVCMGHLNKEKFDYLSMEAEFGKPWVEHFHSGCAESETCDGDVSTLIPADVLHQLNVGYSLSEGRSSAPQSSSAGSLLWAVATLSVWMSSGQP